MSENISFTSANFVLQWHITERCNLRCKHCYQTNYTDHNELNYEQWLMVIDQFNQLIDYLQDKTSQKIKIHINLTGGEPFIHDDFLRLLTEIRRRNFCSFGILTNGTYITSEIAEKLKSLKTSFVQVSMEGSEKTHDSIRSIGSFEKTLTSIRILKKIGIKVLVSFTVHKGNVSEFEEVVKICKKEKVDKVWSDRLIPTGSGENMQSLSPIETETFFKKMHLLNTSKKWYQKKSLTEVSCNRALQFLVSGSYPYKCSAGDSLLTIQANGDVYPCRRMPIWVGNVLQQTLKDIYISNSDLQTLRSPLSTDNECSPCLFKHHCKGGLKCLSYATTGTYTTKDPGCWLKI